MTATFSSPRRAGKSSHHMVLDPVTGSPITLPITTWSAWMTVDRTDPTSILPVVIENLRRQADDLEDTGYRPVETPTVRTEDSPLRNEVIVRMTVRCARLPWDNPVERRVAEDCGYQWRG